MGHGDHNRSFFSLVCRDYCDSKSLIIYIILNKLACVAHWNRRASLLRSKPSPLCSLNGLFELHDCPIHRSICVAKPQRRIEISWQTSERCGVRTLPHKEADIRHIFFAPKHAGCGMPEFRIAAFVSGRGLRACGAMRRGGGVFSSPAWPGRCKGEEGGGAAASALFAGARRPEEEKTILLC